MIIKPFDWLSYPSVAVDGVYPSKSTWICSRSLEKTKLITSKRPFKQGIQKNVKREKKVVLFFNDTSNDNQALRLVCRKASRGSAFFVLFGVVVVPAPTEGNKTKDKTWKRLEKRRKNTNTQTKTHHL